MRVILDLTHTSTGGVLGTLTCGTLEPATFYGWLELMRLLEALDTAGPTPPETSPPIGQP